MGVPKIKINEFRIESIPDSSTWIIIGAPSSGKTTLIENLIYYNRHRFPVAKIMNGNEDANAKFGKTFGQLFVTNKYDPDELKSAIGRQKRVISEKHPYPGCVNVIDDCGDDPKIFRTPHMRGLFKLGSQWWHFLTVIGTQYAMDFPPDIRRATSYVALFREPDPIARDTLYKNFGGICGSRAKFDALMDQLTGDYTCMIIQKRNQSNKLEDCVFYYKTQVLPQWTFGCDEFRKWTEQRFNKSYREAFDI